jgi:outer membrane immunogenic protein
VRLPPLKVTFFGISGTIDKLMHLEALMFRRFALSGAAAFALATSASAADLMITEPGTVMMEAPPAATSWDGGYVGLNIGAASGTYLPDDVDFDIDIDGWFGGAQAGYNMSMGNGVVLGFEGSIDAADIGGSFIDGQYTDNAQIDWTGALTGHIGVAVDGIMPYLLGGVAVAHLNQDDSDTGAAPPYTGSSDAIHVGYTVGAGIAAMLTDNISGFAEARYADYGSAEHSYSATDGYEGTFDAGLTEASIRVGINFLMN